MASENESLKITFEADSKNAIRALKRFKNEISKTDETAKNTSSKSGGMGMLKTAFKRLLAYASAGIVLNGVKNFVRDSALMAASLEGVERAFKNVTFASKVSLSSLREATGGAVSDLKLMQQTVQASNFKLPLENLGKLFEFARIRAQQTGESVEYLTNSIVLGIGRKSPLILDNLGITMVRLKEVMGETAKASMTVAELMEAVSKVAEQETAVLKGLGLTTETTKERIDSLTASWENLKAGFGGNFLGLVGASADGLSNALDKANLPNKINEIKKALDFTGSNVDLAKDLGFSDIIGKDVEFTKTGTAIIGQEVTDNLKLFSGALERLKTLQSEVLDDLSSRFGNLSSSVVSTMIASGEAMNIVNATAKQMGLNVKVVANAFNKMYQEILEGEKMTDPQKKYQQYKEALIPLNAALSVTGNQTAFVNSKTKLLEDTLISMKIAGMDATEQFKLLNQEYQNLISTIEPKQLFDGQDALIKPLGSDPLGVNSLVNEIQTKLQGVKPSQTLQQQIASGAVPVNVSETGGTGESDEAAKKIQKVRGAVTALSQAFNVAFQSGESFGEMMISVLKRMLAQLTATVAAAALLNILFPAATGAKAGGFAAGIKNLLGSTGGLTGALFGGDDAQGSMNPNGIRGGMFNTNRGEMNITVQGVMRGSDIYLTGQRGQGFLDRRLG